MQYYALIGLFIYFFSQGIESIIPDSFLTKYPDLPLTLSLYLTFGTIALFILFGIIGHLLPLFQGNKIWFGKYKGRKWEDIPNDYLYWVVNNYDDSNRTKAKRVLAQREKQNENSKKNTIKEEPKQYLHKYENTLIGIIESSRICWKCHKKTKVIALKFYTNMNGNDSYSTSPKVEHFIKELDPMILNKLQAKYPFFQYRFSKSIQSSYLANCCSNCNMLQGDFQLHEEIDSPFLDSYKMKCSEYLVLENGEIEFSGKAK